MQTCILIVLLYAVAERGTGTMSCHVLNFFENAIDGGQERKWSTCTFIVPVILIDKNTGASKFLIDNPVGLFFNVYDVIKGCPLVILCYVRASFWHMVYLPIAFLDSFTNLQQDYILKKLRYVNHTFCGLI